MTLKTITDNAAQAVSHEAREDVSLSGQTPISLGPTGGHFWKPIQYKCLDAGRLILVEQHVRPSETMVLIYVRIADQVQEEL